MPAAYSCPNCGKSHSLDESFEGQSFRCRGCREWFNLTASTAKSRKKSAGRGAAASSASSRNNKLMIVGGVFAALVVLALFADLSNPDGQTAGTAPPGESNPSSPPAAGAPAISPSIPGAPARPNGPPASTTPVITASGRPYLDSRSLMSEHAWMSQLKSRVIHEPLRVVVTLNDARSEAAALVEVRLERAARFDYEEWERKGVLPAAVAARRDAIQREREEAIRRNDVAPAPDFFTPEFSGLRPPFSEFVHQSKNRKVFYTSSVFDLNAFIQRLGLGPATKIDLETRTIELVANLPNPIPDPHIEEWLHYKHADPLKIIVENVVATPKEAGTRYVEKMIKKLLGEFANEGASGYGFGGIASDGDRYVCVIYPVANPNTLANRISWGKVTSIDAVRRVATIRAELPNPLPETEEVPFNQLVERNRSSTPAPAMAGSSGPPSVNDAERIHKAMRESFNPSVTPDPGETEIDWVRRCLKANGIRVSIPMLKCASRMDVVPEHQDEVVDGLINMISSRSRDEAECEAIFKAMNHWRNSKSDQFLLNAMEDNAPRGSFYWRRKELAQAVAQLDNLPAALCLIGRLTDREDAQIASDALKTMGEVAEGPVMKLLDHKHPSMRAEACNILAKMGGEKALAKVKLARTRDKDASVKDRAKFAYEIMKLRLDEQKAKAEAE